METNTVKFLANVPVEVALEYAKGKPVQSQLNGDEQVMFTLVDGRKMYLHPFVAKKIDDLKVGRGEIFVMCKKQGALRGGASIEWEVYKPDGYGAPPATAPRTPTTAAVPDGLLESSLSRALKTAIAAALAAEKYGKGIGYELRFGPEDVRAMALSVLASSGGRL